MFVHSLNWYFHCSTDTALVHRTTTDFFMVWAAVTPVSVLPAPQGRTMIPDRARPFPNIFVRRIFFVDIGAMVRCIVDGATIAMHKQEE